MKRKRRDHRRAGVNARFGGPKPQHPKRDRVLVEEGGLMHTYQPPKDYITTTPDAQGRPVQVTP